MNATKTGVVVHRKNISSSIPIRKKIFILPILLDEDTNQILMFSENIFYKEWKKNNKNYFLINYILPNEDLEDIIIMQNRMQEIENYDFRQSTYN